MFSKNHENKQKTIRNKKYRLLSKTGSTCSVCTSQIEKNPIILHKTKRQIHCLCDYCAKHYLTPITENITKSLQKGIRRNVNNIQCSGCYYSNTRNICKTKIDITKIQIPPEWDLYTSIFRIKYILNSHYSLICPNTKCGSVIDVEENYNGEKITCFDCKQTWCRQCNVTPYHDNKTCIEYEIESKNCDNSKYIFELKEQGLLKFCPQCKTPILKNSGCNKMYCSLCNTKWCWICSSLNIDYDHYNANKNTSCSNKLWEGIET